MVNVEPTPYSLSTVTSPPISRQKWRVIARPSPVPPKRRVVEESAWENASNRRPSCSSVMPMPVSETAKVTSGESRLGLGVEWLGTVDAGRSGLGLAGVGTGDAGRLGLGLAGIGCLKPAPTAGGLVGAGFKVSTWSGSGANLPRSSLSIRSGSDPN